MVDKVMLFPKIGLNLTKFLLISRPHFKLTALIQRGNIQAQQYCSAVESSGEEDEEYKASIEAKRNVSGLPKYMRDRMEHVLNVPEDKFEFHKTTKYKRRVYAKYGKRSGVNPGYMWPSKEEMAEILEERKEWEPSLEERKLNIEAKRKAEEELRREKEEHVLKQMERMPQYIEQYKQRLNKLKELENKQDLKKKAMMEEARDFFGYAVDHRDPRFKVMQEMKEEEEKLAKKKKKKEEKQTRWISLLQEEAKKKKKSPKPEKSEE